MKTILKHLYFVTCFMFIFTVPVYAYIDPSIMTYAIQIIAGVAVAIGAVVGIYWRRAKKKVKDTLGLDDNDGKEVEENIVTFDNKQSSK